MTFDSDMDPLAGNTATPRREDGSVSELDLTVQELCETIATCPCGPAGCRICRELASLLEYEQ